MKLSAVTLLLFVLSGWATSLETSLRLPTNKVKKRPNDEDYFIAVKKQMGNADQRFLQTSRDLEEFGAIFDERSHSDQKNEKETNFPGLHDSPPDFDGSGPPGINTVLPRGLSNTGLPGLSNANPPGLEFESDNKRAYAVSEEVVSQAMIAAVVKERRPADASTTPAEIIERLLLGDHQQRRLVSLSPSEAATIGDALAATHDGNLELGLDILSSTVVSGICFAVSWALAAPTGGVSVAAAPLLCAAAGFWSGILLFAQFDWLGIGDPGADDAWLTIEAGESEHAGGDSLEVNYHREGETDHDSLGSIDRGEVKSWREDLDARKLVSIELLVHDTDDICVRNFAFQVGREPSGTGRQEHMGLSAATISLITGQPLLGNDQCLYFGDEEGAIGNFKFHWPSAFRCQNNFGSYLTLDYTHCLTWALYSYDIRRGGQYRRYTFSDSPSLPSHYSTPMSFIFSYGSQLCMDLENYGTDNYNRINLINCNHNPSTNSAQLFDFDHDGRIRSKVDTTKCVEAGIEGTLYNKLYIYDCHEGDWQRWIRHTDGRIKNVHHGMYIGLAYCAKEHGRPLELRTYEEGACGDAQQWSWNS